MVENSYNCPLCGAKMKIRYAKKGVHIENLFCFVQIIQHVKD